METKEITLQTYTYDELSEEAKEEAIEEMSDVNISFEWWDYDGHLDLSVKEMKDRHITDGEYPESLLFSHKHLYFDVDRGQYIQFDGLTVNNDNVFRKLLRIPKRLWENCQYSFESPRNSNTRLVIESLDRDFTPKQQAIVDRAIDIFSDKVHEAWVNLRNTYEYEVSKEGIEETIRINDYRFYEDGKRSKTIYA